MHSLIEDNKIDFEEELLEKIASLGINDANEKTVVEVREKYQYGTELSIKDDLYRDLFELANKVIEKTREIIMNEN